MLTMNILVELNNFVQTNALPNFPNMELSMLELQQAIMATSPLRKKHLSNIS